MTLFIDIVGFMGTGTVITIWILAKAEKMGLFKGTLTGEVVDEAKATLRKYREKKIKNEFEIRV